MEPLLQSVQQYVDLLKRCRTPEVANWKPKDLEHSLHWASYFKNVYEKVKKKESVRRQLESHLTSLGQHIGPGFGTDQLNFDFLPHGIDYLLKSLLENPALSEELLMLLLKSQHQHLVRKYLRELAQSRILQTSLTAVQDCIKQREHSND